MSIKEKTNKFFLNSLKIFLFNLILFFKKKFNIKLIFSILLIKIKIIKNIPIKNNINVKRFVKFENKITIITKQNRDNIFSNRVNKKQFA